MCSKRIADGVIYRQKTLGDNEYPPDEGSGAIVDAVPLKRLPANWCSNGTMPLPYRLTALPRAMPVCREDVDRQRENVFFTAGGNIDGERFHNRSLDFPAAIEAAIKAAGCRTPCVTSMSPTSNYFQRGRGKKSPDKCYVVSLSRNPSRRNRRR
jgi:hypothetical protein